MSPPMVVIPARPLASSWAPKDDLREPGPEEGRRAEPDEEVRSICMGSPTGTEALRALALPMLVPFSRTDIVSTAAVMISFGHLGDGDGSEVGEGQMERGGVAEDLRG